MEALRKLLVPMALLVISTAAFADTAHEDAATVHADTVKTKTVSYSCQNAKKVTVKYGFNKQNLPTYAEAHLNGKTRFMPVNLHRSDQTASEFGDENNFSLSTDAITFKTVKKGYVNIQSPSSEILFKGCKARK